MTTHLTILLYTSPTCPLSNAVEQFLDDYEVPVKRINIDLDPEAREALATLNGGYPSVPTLVLPDGTRLVEPSIPLLREKLGIESDGWLDRALGFSH